MYVRPLTCKIAEKRPKLPKNIAVAYRTTTDASICPPGLVTLWLVFFPILLLVIIIFKCRHNSYHAIICEWNRQFLYCVGLDGTIHMRFLSLVSKIVTVFVYLDPIIPNSDDMV